MDLTGTPLSRFSAKVAGLTPVILTRNGLAPMGTCSNHNTEHLGKLPLDSPSKHRKLFKPYCVTGRQHFHQFACNDICTVHHELHTHY